MGGGCKTTAMTHLSPGYLCFAHISWLLAFLLLAWELKPTLLQVFLITWEGTSSSSSAPKQSYMLKKRSQHSAPQRPTGWRQLARDLEKTYSFQAGSLLVWDLASSDTALYVPGVSHCPRRAQGWDRDVGGRQVCPAGILAFGEHCNPAASGT